MGKLNWGQRAYAVFLLWAATAIALPAQTFTTLHRFDGTDGSYPDAPVIQATDGNLYGPTSDGGSNGLGTVFKITPRGTLTTLHTFDNTDGAYPGGLVQATDGDLYGATLSGGASSGCSLGCGTIFRMTLSGTLDMLYSFCPYGSCVNFGGPRGVLVQATDGNLYGTTGFFGIGGDGMVFKITPSGTFTTLSNFDGTGGADPSGLVQATDGNFYGTTLEGGANSEGTVFKITPSGTLTTLYSFCSQSGCTDGAFPQAALVQATDGNLYGTTGTGGANAAGTIFKIAPIGELTTLYNFCPESGCTDGSNPYTPLVQATDGNFYGTATNGGANGYGTVFKITPSGTLTTLHSFGGGDGVNPAAGLAQATNGRFYGITNQGGGSNSCPRGCGTVFSLSVGLDPFVETLPTSGKVEKAVKILGTNLTGATSVSFNGAAAVFTVVSPSLITTTVPAGATTGKVQVVTPSGTLSSNVPFRVLP